MAITFKTDYEDILVFTHNDVDGIVGAYILKHLFDNNLENESWDRNVHVYCCDYSNEYQLVYFKEKTQEFKNEAIAKNPSANIVVYMIDYAIQPNEDMIKFSNWLHLNNIKFIWIDHHITAIENLSHYNIPGLQESGVCGAMNTWKYLIKEGQEYPKFLQMVSDFDTWNESSEFSMEKQLLPLIYYVESLGNTINDNNSNLVKTLKTIFSNQTENIEDKMIANGLPIYNFVKAINIKNTKKIYNKTWNNYSCLILNTTQDGDMQFNNHIDADNVDLLVTWSFDGTSYKYGLYTRKPNINVGLICEKYFNGGGHQKCGGGSLDKMIF